MAHCNRYGWARLALWARVQTGYNLGETTVPRASDERPRGVADNTPWRCTDVTTLPTAPLGLARAKPIATKISGRQLGAIAALVRDPGTASLPINTWAGQHLRDTLINRRAPEVGTTVGFAICRKACGDVSRCGVWCLRREATGNEIASLRCIVCAGEMKTVGAHVLGIRSPIWEVAIPPSSCARCGSDAGVELHHWAPRHLFEDADYWPMAYLCQTCHRRWHQVVTPNMAQHHLRESIA